MQAADTAIAQAQHRRRSLPEHADIATGKERRLAVLERLVAAETRVSDLQRAQRKSEADLEPVRQRRVRDTERVDDGSVTDPKQLSALMEEIEHLGRRINELEDAELEIMGELEDATTEVDRLTEERSELETRLRGWMAARDEQLAAIGGELGELETRRTQLAGEISPDLVALYDRVRAGHDGLGAAELRQRRCLGCRIELNAADLRSFATSPPDEVLRCEECGRILVRTPDSGI